MTQHTMQHRIDEALKDTRPTMVEFYADWCPHCQRMKPVIEELRRRVDDRANIISVECDQNPDEAEKYKIEVYPTFVIFRDGQEAWRASGEQPLDVLEDMLRRFE